MSESTELVVRCQNLGRRFETEDGVVQALHDVNLDVEAGSFTALVGPSGCGKTTLMHIIANLDTEYDGRLVTRAKKGQIAYLFQEPRLLPWQTAEQNLIFILKSQGMKGKEAKRRARQQLKVVGLDGFENKFPSQLSGGMQQRVALARALVVDPKVMLMDEPFASLDELTARKLRSELLRLFSEVSPTIIFVTHNVSEAAYLADRVVVLGTNPGRVVAEIPVDMPRPRDYDGPEVAEVAREIVSHLHLE